MNVNEEKSKKFTIDNRKTWLLDKLDTTILKLNHKRILVRFFVIPMPNLIQHGKCRADNCIGFLFI